MTQLLTAAQMRAIETAAIESGAVTGLTLMERAGQGVVDAMYEHWPELGETRPGAQTKVSAGGPAPQTPRDISSTKKTARILCGPGNNGGDGFVVARLLHHLGWEVEVLFLGQANALPADAALNHQRWCAIGEVRDLCTADLGAEPWAGDLIVDALFGTGLTRGLDPEAQWGKLLPERTHVAGRPKVVAVDLPSGLCSDSGRVLGGHALWADLTVSFHRLKAGHVLAQGPQICGFAVTKSIGLDDNSHGTNPVQLVAPPSPVELDKACLIGSTGHKFTYGHAVILSGPASKGGAARLAARGALRIGAGVVTVGCPHGALVEHAAQLNAIMLAEIGDATALNSILHDTRVNALCIGPGLGMRETALGLVEAGINSRRPVVLDADALTLISRNYAMIKALHNDCILTPHAGEFARLFPDIAEKLTGRAITGPAYSKLEATHDAAVRAGCVVLFKGPDTVIAAPDGRCHVNAACYDRAAHWLATAGSGDVLAGFITGMLARGCDPFRAAEIGAWLHVACARRFGPGLIAEDLPEQLPGIFRELGL